MSAALAPSENPALARLIPLGLLHESPFNKRRTWGDLQELADSFKDVGILEDLLVRPHPKKPGDFQLVFGHRRFRAAKLAKLETVPAKIRNLTDAQTVEVQCIENLQREDVHPLEEAEGYEQLLKIGKFSHDELAVKVGKSRSYIFGRLKLLALCEKVREAFAKDEISASVALYIARIPVAKLQIQALHDCQGDRWSGPRSARDARDHIEKRFMLRLVDAPFDRGDATLAPAAGACTTCPKRTGNQSELFSDVKSADVCTDPECFAGKKEALGQRLLDAAKEEGRKILKGKAGIKAIDEASNDWNASNTHVDLDQACSKDSKRRTYRQLLKGTDVEVLAAADEEGRVHDLATRVEVAKAIKDKVKLPVRSSSSSSSSSSSTYNYAKKEKERKAKADVEQLRDDAIASAIGAAAQKTPPGKTFWPFLVGLVIETRLDFESAFRRRGIKLAGNWKQIPANARKAALKMKESEARAIAIEILAGDDAYNAGAELGGAIKLAAEFYDLDVKKIGDAAVAAAEAAKQAKKPKAKASKNGRA